MAQAAVTELDYRDRRQRRRFVALEQRLLGRQPRFVPEIEADVDKRLRGSSAFFEETEHTLLVASNGRDVACCSPMVNRRWQRDGGEDVGFIGYFAAAEDAGGHVADLLQAAERWLAERGVRRVIAPHSGDAFHGFAAQVAGFDEDPMFPLRWQPPYYSKLLEAAGYRPTRPFWVYEVDFASERYRAAVRAAADQTRYTVRAFDKKRWSEELETLRHLQNETFAGEWEFHAMTAGEYAEFFGAMKAVFDERQLLFAEAGGRPVGFCWGLPDWTPLMRSLGGRMGPAQTVRFLLRARHYRRAGLAMVGVLAEERGNHAGRTLATSLYRHYQERGLGRAFYYPVNEDNRASRRLAEALGGEGRNLYTTYEKVLG